jgi:hypothetical protein
MLFSLFIRHNFLKLHKPLVTFTKGFYSSAVIVDSIKFSDITAPTMSLKLKPSYQKTTVNIKIEKLEVPNILPSSAALKKGNITLFKNLMLNGEPLEKDLDLELKQPNFVESYYLYNVTKFLASAKETSLPCALHHLPQDQIEVINLGVQQYPFFVFAYFEKYIQCQKLGAIKNDLNTLSHYQIISEEKLKLALDLIDTLIHFEHVPDSAAEHKTRSQLNKVQKFKIDSAKIDNKTDEAIFNESTISILEGPLRWIEKFEATKKLASETGVEYLVSPDGRSFEVGYATEIQSPNSDLAQAVEENYIITDSLGNLYMQSS